MLLLPLQLLLLCFWLATHYCLLLWWDLGSKLATSLFVLLGVELVGMAVTLSPKVTFGLCETIGYFFASYAHSLASDFLLL